MLVWIHATLYGVGVLRAWIRSIPVVGMYEVMLGGILKPQPRLTRNKARPALLDPISHFADAPAPARKVVLFVRHWEGAADCENTTAPDRPTWVPSAPPMYLPTYLRKGRYVRTPEVPDAATATELLAFIIGTRFGSCSLYPSNGSFKSQPYEQPIMSPLQA